MEFWINDGLEGIDESLLVGHRRFLEVNGVISV
jgi:hypothetical protein